MLSRLPFPYPRTLTDEWIASTVAQREAGTAYHLVITGQEDGQELVIGCVGLRLDLKPGTGNLGYWVGRRYWGHGVATEAASRVALGGHVKHQHLGILAMGQRNLRLGLQQRLRYVL